MNSTTDYHIHSWHSPDSRTAPDRIVDTAIKRGLTEIAVTDHDTIAGGLEAARYAEGKPIKVIVGAEIDTDRGEIIGLNLKEEITERHLPDVIRRIKEQGGLVMVPHPYGFLRRHRIRVPLESLSGMIDIIEVHNGRSLIGHDRRAWDAVRRLNLQPVTGSDAHFAFEIGNANVPLVNWRGVLAFVLTAIIKRLGRKKRATGGNR